MLHAPLMFWPSSSRVCCPPCACVPRSGITSERRWLCTSFSWHTSTNGSSCQPLSAWVCRWPSESLCSGLSKRCLWQTLILPEAWVIFVIFIDFHGLRSTAPRFRGSNAISELSAILVWTQDAGKGGLSLRGVAFMTVLTVLAVLESTLRSFFRHSNAIPQGPFHTKNSTESKITTARKIRYGSFKTLRRVLRSACFPGKRRRKTGQTVKNYGGSKMLRIRVPYYF